MKSCVGCAIAGIAAMFFLAFASPARASFELVLQSGASTVTVLDNGVGDSNSSPGIITFSGSVGSYTTNITTGYSNAPGDTGGGLLQISTLDAHNNSVQSMLKITLEDTGFTQPPGPALQLGSSVGLTVFHATSGDWLTFQSYADPSDAQGGMAVTTGPQPFGFPNITTSTSYNNTAAPVNFTGSGPYSMTNVTTMAVSSGGQLNLSGTTTVIPEPFSFSAMALGGGLMLMKRRRRA